MLENLSQRKNYFENILRASENGWYFNRKYSLYLSLIEMSNLRDFGKPFLWQSIVKTSLFT